MTNHTKTKSWSPGEKWESNLWADFDNPVPTPAEGFDAGRADMKREVLAEIASMLEVTHAIASPYDQPFQEQDRQTLRELKRRVEGLLP